jgi:succinyl-diaminopimelate desuccinylase
MRNFWALLSLSSFPLATPMTTPTVRKTSVVDLARDLIRRPSVTPNDSGCQDLIAERLERLGFVTETLKYHDVTNLWAIRHGAERSEKLVVFAGHTDVVPAGPAEKWKHPPFEGTIENGILHGRGAVDMKGGLASFVVAAERFVTKYPHYRGSIGLLLTSDEEGEARWGTQEVISELMRRGVSIDMGIVGEPSSIEQLGDVVKVGRRGSLGGELVIHGIQGHVAYPHLAKNPLHESLGALKDLVDMHWDDGTEDFHPTTFQLSNVAGGTGATNVIPGHKVVHFNFRFSPASTVESLQIRVETILANHDLDYDIDWHEISHPYETPRDSELVQAAVASVKAVTGVQARTCTSGGTSDGRFLAAAGAQVVELGPINKTIHKIDEHVTIADLEKLTEIYEDLLQRLLYANDEEMGFQNHEASTISRS